MFPIGSIIALLVAILALIAAGLALFASYWLIRKKLPAMEYKIRNKRSSSDLAKSLHQIGELEARVRELEKNAKVTREQKTEKPSRAGKGTKPNATEHTDPHTPAPKSVEEKAPGGTTASEKPTPQETKTLYAKNSQDRFLIQVSSNAEGAKYRITLDPETKQGTFVLTSLRKLASNDNYHSIVDLEGNGSVTESSDYDTLSEGRCREISEGIWQVTRNLKIKLR